MDLDLTDDQQLFRDTTNRFLADHFPVAEARKLFDDPTGFDRDLWTRGAELGWTSMVVPEEHGGGSVSGDGIRDLAIVVEEAGRALAPGPIVPTNVVAFAIAQGNNDALAKELLPGIAAGELRAANTGPTTLELMDGSRLSGVVAPVQDAQVADHVLVTTRDGTQVVIACDAKGVSVEPLRAHDVTRRFARLRFDNVEVAESAVVTKAAVDRQLALTLAMQCADSVGATDVAYAMTLQYVKDRKSFGRPIGSYQALKHRLADMLLWLESSKAATVAAVNAVQADRDALQTARVAKAYVANRCPAIIRDCLHMHGGIGFTWEHDIHLYLRRVDLNATLHGGVDEQLDALAPAIGF